MNVFERASEDEIKKLIFSSSSKSCDLNRIPTSVFGTTLVCYLTIVCYRVRLTPDYGVLPRAFGI